jgi:diguanylate cyclase (GGDEF)-like protein
MPLIRITDKCIYGILCVALLVLAAVAAVHAASTTGNHVLMLTSAQDRYELPAYMDILRDDTGKLTIDDVSSPRISSRFMPVGPNPPSLGFTTAACWVRFTVAQTGSSTHDDGSGWLLDMGRAFLSSVTVYIANTTHNHGTTGNHWLVYRIQSAKRPSDVDYRYKPFVFQLPSALRHPLRIYVRAQSDTSLYLLMSICRSQAYLAGSKGKMFDFGIYFGVILALIPYNLFLCVYLRDKSYLWYALHVLCVAIYVLQIDGLTIEYLFPGMPRLLASGIVVSAAMAMITASQFTRSFLSTKQCAPFSDRLLLTHMVLTGAVLALGPFISFPVLNSLCTILGALTTVVIMCSGIACWVRGLRSARFFLLAWTCYMVGVVIYVSTITGSIPFSGFGYYGFQVASAIEAILLAFALGDRIKILQREQKEGHLRESRYRKLAITDGLTGLYNSEHFRDGLYSAVDIAHAKGSPLSLVMLDVDNFKCFNDTYGHLQGDKVLSRMGRVILLSIRETDLPSRYGGEEFAVLLPNTDIHAAMEVAERIRTAFENKIASQRTKDVTWMTVSAGVAALIEGENSSALMSRADQALYRAKKAGKNRVVSWDDTESLDDPAKQPMQISA